MGDYRIVIEGVGGHGCGRDVNISEERMIKRCGNENCTDCKTLEFIKALGLEVKSAILQHWPVPGAAGTMRDRQAGPVDNLVTGTRTGKW